MARDWNGNYWFTFIADREVPLVYDSSGTFLRSVGRYGKGPGEFTGVLTARSFGTDTIYVMDLAQARLSVYIGNYDVPVRMTNMQGPLSRDYLVLADGTIITSAHNRAPRFAGAVLHVFSADGTYRTSFGHDGVVRPTDRLTLTRRLSRAELPNRFWSLSHRYVLEEWDTDGRRYRTLTRRADWFSPITDYQAAAPDRTPQTLAIDVNMDADGLLWVLSQRGDRAYREGLAPGRLEMREEYRITSFNRYLDSMLEVIDPRSGDLLASRRFDVFASQLAVPYMVARNDAFRDDPMILVREVRLSKR